MVKLSDYLNYLYTEVIQARKQADITAVAMAKEYAKHEYLKFFKVPRYTMPSVKMEIPIKISELDADVKYNFKMDEPTFLYEVNAKIELLNKEKKLNIRTLTTKDIKSESFTESIKKLENFDYKFVNNKEKIINRLDINDKINNFFRKGEFIKADTPEGQSELNNIIREAFLNRYTPVSANLKNIFIDPNTMNETDKGKLMVNLHVEMVDEGVRINAVDDGKGNIIEEIIVD